MKILPINNISTNNTQFKAKFPKQDVQEFLKEIKVSSQVDDVSKLYTMLDIIKNQSGEKAEIEHRGLWHRILIDGKSMTGANKYFCAIHALTEATVKCKNTLLKKTPISRLSEEDFEIAYNKNCKKTVKDIENLFEE